MQVGWERSGIEPANDCIDVKGNRVLVFGLNSSCLESDPVNGTCEHGFMKDREFLD